MCILLCFSSDYSLSSCTHLCHFKFHENESHNNCEKFQKKFSSYACLGYIANNLMNNEGGWQEMPITIKQ